ncbi:MAG: ribonuclease N [Proteobacteria bacterium]|nr:ribonuclease N [Pseudomonadota bacterium]HQR04992.1 ribonuclease domain-containing protein [Rhodocyclaceae bacterium]
MRLVLAALLTLCLGIGLARGLPPEIATRDLPPEARATLALINRGGPFPYRRDGMVFGNYEKHLPFHSRGYYHEYTVPTPRAHDRGARRIVTGAEGERYYSPDHYQSLLLIHP